MWRLERSTTHRRLVRSINAVGPLRPPPFFILFPAVRYHRGLMPGWVREGFSRSLIMGGRNAVTWHFWSNSAQGHVTPSPATLKSRSRRLTGHCWRPLLGILTVCKSGLEKPISQFNIHCNEGVKRYFIYFRN